MKVCPLCGETYAPFVDFCFADGEVLSLEAVAPEPDVADAFDAPPPPKMLQGAKGAGYTRSATPVPRARRGGRSLVRAEGGGVYTPPADDAAPQATVAVTPGGATPRVPWDDGELVAMEDVADEAVAKAAPPPPDPATQTSTPAAMPAATRPRTPIPAPTPPARPAAGERYVGPEAAPARSLTHEAEEEEEDAGGAPMWALALVGVLSLGAAVALGAFTVFYLYDADPTDPADPTEQPARLPTPPASGLQVGVQPRADRDTDAPETQGVPEPAPLQPGPAPIPPPAPASTEPVPASTEPVPASTEPVPASTEPAPASTEPAPASTEPSDGVAAVDPDAPPAEPLAEVTFNTDPAGARVYIGGQLLGTTPLRQPGIPFGTVDVKFELDGYETRHLTFDVPGPRYTPPITSLTALPADAPEPSVTTEVTSGPRKVMFFYTRPEGGAEAVEVLVGDKSYEPAATVDVAPGEHSVTVKLDNGTSLQFSCRVLSLEERPGAQQVRLPADCP